MLAPSMFMYAFKVDLVGKTLSVNSNMAIFITMNPGYSGRSNLPDNLKQVFSLECLYVLLWCVDLGKHLCCILIIHVGQCKLI